MSGYRNAIIGRANRKTERQTGGHSRLIATQ